MGIVWNNLLKMLKKKTKESLSSVNSLDNRNCEKDLLNDRVLIEYNCINKAELPKMEVVVLEDGTVEVKQFSKPVVASRYKNICLFKKAIVEYYIKSKKNNVKEKFTLGI